MQCVFSDKEGKIQRADGLSPVKVQVSTIPLFI